MCYLLAYYKSKNKILTAIPNTYYKIAKDQGNAKNYKLKYEYLSEYLFNEKNF